VEICLLQNAQNIDRATSNQYLFFMVDKSARTGERPAGAGSRLYADVFEYRTASVLAVPFVGSTSDA
jgi:hypothetical protein